VGVRQISSDRATCALLGNGTVWCWGTGDSRSAHNRRSRQPHRVDGLRDVVQLSMNGSHGCALTATGTVYCFDCSDSSREAVTPAPMIARAREVAVGQHHACALLADRSVFCWGDNDYGQLGDGSRKRRANPVKVLPAGSVAPPIVD
jgi:alpha-tubulin suppressor-like RCC1 family protein